MAAPPATGVPSGSAGRAPAAPPSGTGESAVLPGPALGIVETQSIARGVVCADAMVKKAPVTILQNHPVSPGKFVVVIAGQVAAVEEAMRAGEDAALHLIVDRLFLPQAHEQLAPLLAGHSRPAVIGAVGIIETATVVATVLASDAAAKAAHIDLLEMRLGQGIGGKGYLTLTGELPDVEAAMAAGVAAIAPALLVLSEIIPAPHDDLRTRLIF
ncbi:MAG: BMC domain-containing protein [Deltaproteobacteria bacterium]|nr:BMC domain-containing protein [Deltaproteobacteria bacterium]